jgi:hypothetical protein
MRDVRNLKHRYAGLLLDRLILAAGCLGLDRSCHANVCLVLPWLVCVELHDRHHQAVGASRRAASYLVVRASRV